MALSFSDVKDLLVTSYNEWSDDNASRLGAALAYYTIFSLAPLLIILIGAVDLVWGAQSGAVQAQVLGQIESTVGASGADVVRSMLGSRGVDSSGSIIAIVVGVGALIFGATGVFAQLQGALNTVWNVEPEESSIRHLILTRLLSFGIILVAGLLVLVLMVASAAISSVEQMVAGVAPGTVTLMRLASLAVSVIILTLLFAIIFRQLPDVQIVWRDVLIGAGFTAVLFTIGKLGLGLYLGRASVASAYGAAGSFVVLLLWIYYSALIILFGAEFTQVYAQRYGSHIRPAEYAARANGAALQNRIEAVETVPPTGSPTHLATRDTREDKASGASWGRRIAVVGAAFFVGRYFGSRK